MIKRLISRVLIALTLLLAAFSTVVMAQQNTPLQPQEAFALTVRQNADGALALHWRVAEGYYLYRSEFAAEADGQSLSLSLPEGEIYDDPYFGSGQIYRGDVTATLDTSGRPVTLRWQGCQQDGICYAPQSVQLDAAGVAQPADTATTNPGWSPQPASDPQQLVLAADQGMVQGLAARGGAALVVAGFWGFGLLLAFTPCVFPMFPIVAGMLARQGEALTPRRGLVLTGAYVMAMAAAFALMGVAAAWSGANLQMMLQSPAALTVVALLFVLLALSMFGFLELQMPAALQNRLGRINGPRGSLGGAAVLGFTSALIVGPCVTAPLAGALLYIAGTGDVVLGAAALFAMGLGQGLPLLAVGLFGPRILPQSGGWLDRAKHAFGAIFLGFAIWLVGRVLPGPLTLALWAALLIGAAVFLGALDRPEGAVTRNRRLVSALGVILLMAGVMQGLGAALGAQDPLRPLAPLTATAVPGSGGVKFANVTTRTGLEQALAAVDGQPALLYLTADWCVTCRAIERGPLADPAVHAALSWLATIKLDLSDFNAETQALMQQLGAAGPPTMIFLDDARVEPVGSRLIGDPGSAALLASIAQVLR